MAGLLDIAPSSEQVTVRGVTVDVTGVSVSGIAILIGRFPELRTLLSGGELDLDKLMALGGDIVNAIIAAGTGAPGNRDAEKVAGSLGLEDQAALLTAILNQTMPSGIGPFVKRLESLGDVLSLTTLQPQEHASKPGTTNDQMTTASPVISQSA